MIRKASNEDLDDVLAVQRAAFGSEEEADLVNCLLADESAHPGLSLLAVEDGRAVGHALFTNARLEPSASLSMVLMAPLAVVPQAQNRGIGGRLMEHGAELLSAAGVDLIFVLGHPEYYPRYGFRPAGRLGFEATYPIAAENADAWMLLELRAGAAGVASGRVGCADMLRRPEYWIE